MSQKVRSKLHQVARVDPRTVKLILAIVSLIIFVLGASAPVDPSPWGGP